MRSARPTQAMTLIGELGLAATVFPAPEDLVVEEGGAVVGGVDGVAALPGTWCVCVYGGGGVDACAAGRGGDPLTDREPIVNTDKQVPAGPEGHLGDGDGAALQVLGALRR